MSNYYQTLDEYNDLNMSENITPRELQQHKYGIIIGLGMAIDEIMNVMASTESDDVFLALDPVCAKLKAERLARAAELKEMLDGSDE